MGMDASLPLGASVLLAAQSPGGGITSVNGDTGPAVKVTLASIYTFGLADAPTTDNLFAMPTGNRRWADASALVTGFGTVSDAFYETPGSAGDSRVGAWITRRWRSGARPSTTFRTDIDYDAGYVGAPLDGTEWVIEQQYLSNSLDETKVVGDLYSQRKTYLWNFFNGQPQGFPSPGALAGAYALESLEQYHGGPDVGVNITHRRTGWGQVFAFTRPQRAGITASYIGVYNNNTTADASGNGAGFWVSAGNESTNGPRGFYEAHMLAGGTLGAWELGLWSYDGATMVQRATFGAAGGTVNGATIATLFGGRTTESFVAEKVDITVAGTTALIPARAGFYFLATRVTAYGISLAGVATGSLVWSIGNDGGSVNIQGATTTTAVTLNAQIAVGNPSFLAQANAIGTTPLANMSTPAVLKITTPPTGITAGSKVTFFVNGVWVPV